MSTPDMLILDAHTSFLVNGSLCSWDTCPITSPSDIATLAAIPGTRYQLTESTPDCFIPDANACFVVNGSMLQFDKGVPVTDPLAIAQLAAVPVAGKRYQVIA
jgi:hypothetical protein